MSKISALKAILDELGANAPLWDSVDPSEAPPAAPNLIGGFDSDPNADMAAAARNAAADLYKLYETAVRLRTRLKAGKANILAADRDSIYAILKVLEQ